MFSAAFLEIIVLGGLVWTGAGAAVLMFLLLKDWKNQQLW